MDGLFFILTKFVVTQLEELWNIVREYVPTLDDFYMQIVWRWLVSRGDDFEVLIDASEGTLVCVYSQSM